MIERYQSANMKAIFSLENRFKKMLMVEEASILALHQRGIIDDFIKTSLLNKDINLDDILEREKTLKHDVLAFVESMMSQMNESKRYFHYGLTSTDVVDTAQSLILSEASEVLDNHFTSLKDTILVHAKKYQSTPMMARTHGMYAEMSTFGLRYLRFHEDLTRAYTRFKTSLQDVLQVKLSGAVGHYSILPIEHEHIVAKILQLVPQKLSTQVLARDKHAVMMSHMAIVGAVIEDFVLDIRLLSRSDVHEVAEGFSDNQKGSSAMPHKKNPVTSENLTGLSRMLRGYVTMAMENIALWHERDISHSSVERVILEDGFSLLDTMFQKVHDLIKHLVVFEDHMQSHIEATYQTTFSQRLLHVCIDRNLDRIKSYEHIQKASFEAFNNKTKLQDIIINDTFFNPLHQDIDFIFNQEEYVKHLVQVFDDLYPKK